MPICGEDIEVLKETWEGVTKIDYSNYKVYVLDDGNDSKAKNLAKRFGFTYLCRPNRGEFKKAGNLRYGYEHSESEFVLVLDADFVPKPEILKEMIPSFEDEKLGILQSPQFFPKDKQVLNSSLIQYGAAAAVVEFYKYLQPARHNYGAVICVGTNAVYRREAVQKGGGPAMVDKSEDVRQGLKIITSGYKVGYTPLILAIGLCPDNPQNYFKQHNRWSSGAVEMLFSKDFWKTPLSLFQRMIYLLNITYYLREASALILPVTIFILLLNHYNSLNLWNLLYFVPYTLVNWFILSPDLSPRIRLAKTMAGITQVYTYFYTLLFKLLGVTHAWVPTNQKMIQFSTGYIPMVLINFGFLFSIATLSTKVVIDHPNFWQNPATYFLVWIISLLILNHTAFAILNLNFIYRTKLEQVQQGLLSDSGLKFWYAKIFLLILTAGIGLTIGVVLSSGNYSLFNQEMRVENLLSYVK
ncbi:MAG: hypothetical protein OHK0017_09160 [Patescibacteria group bacterium]